MISSENIQHSSDHPDSRTTQLLAPLSEMRKNQCLSQSQVAEKLGTASRSHIAAIEQGKVVPRLDTYLRLLNLYGYTVSITKLPEADLFG